MQNNEDYVLGVLQDGGLVSRKQIDGARSRLNGEPGVLDVLIDDGALSEVDVWRTLAAQAHMDWIDISTMIIPPQVINKIRGEERAAVQSNPGRVRRDRPCGRSG